MVQRLAEHTVALGDGEESLTRTADPPSYAVRMKARSGAPL